MNSKRSIKIALIFMLLAITLAVITACQGDDGEYSIPSFTAGGLSLGYFVEDMNLNYWIETTNGKWANTGNGSTFRTNSEGRIYMFYVDVQAFTHGIWSFAGIEPIDSSAMRIFELPTTVEEIQNRFGDGTSYGSILDNSNNEWSYIIYANSNTGIVVQVGYDIESRKVVYVAAEGLPPVISRPTPAPTAP